jgi:predicted PurR-regulated permease PerM
VLVLYPFFSAILWAAILTYTTWPLFEWLRTRARLGRQVAAFAMVLLTAIVLVLPLALAVPSGADDFDHLSKVVVNALQAGLPPAPRWLYQIPLLGRPLGDLWSSWAADVNAMTAFFRPYFGAVGEFVLSLLLGLAHGILSFLLALLVAFFFFASGDRLAAALSAVLYRIAGARAERIITVAGAIMRGVVYGLLGTAVVQGILTAFGLWVAGVPRPVLLGVVAGCLSVLPIGAPAVWIPAALWLAEDGHLLLGILLCVYGVVFISGSDGIIRPFFIARGAQLPFLLTFLGVLGGAIAFGLLGIFVGPVLIGVAFTLIYEFAQGEGRGRVSTRL